MRHVLAAEPAELAQLEPLARLLLVLRRAVVAALARGARQRDDVSHCCNNCRDSGLGTRDSGTRGSNQDFAAESRAPSPESRRYYLFNNFADRAGADGAAPFTNREPCALLE